MAEQVYTKTLNSFGGEDFVFYFDDKVVGEIQEFSFTQDLKTNRLQGSLVATYFDREPFDPMKKYDIKIKMLSEYGHFAEHLIIDAEFQTFHVRYAIDMSYTEFHYTFEAKSFMFGRYGQNQVPAPKYSTLEDKLQFVKLNKDNILGQDLRQNFLKDIQRAIANGELSPSILFD